MGSMKKVTRIMNHLLKLLVLFPLVAFAQTILVPANTASVTITFNPVVAPPPTCGAQPPPVTQTASCPTGTTGSWTQTQTYSAAAYPTCWVAGAFSPTSPPAGACTSVVTPSPTTGIINNDSWQNTIPNVGVIQGATETFVVTSAIVSAVHTYNIGLSGSTDTFANVPWSQLACGSVVNIYQGTYAYKIGLRGIGCTASNPIIINGVSDSSGHKPVLNFANALTAPGSKNLYAASGIEVQGGIIIVRNGSSDPYDTPDAYGTMSGTPSYVLIQGLQIQGAVGGKPFTNHAGATANYIVGAGGIWVQQGQHVVLRNNDITGNDEGIFVMAKDGMLTEAGGYISSINNRVWLNGVSGSPTYHNFYMQSVAPVTTGNYIGVTIGGGGSSYKTRSAQDVFTHNYVVCGAQCLDFVEPQDQTNGIAVQPFYGTDYLTGNTIISSGQVCIHFGGDNEGQQDQSTDATHTVFQPPANTSATPYRHVFYWWNNTCQLTSSGYNQAITRLSTFAQTGYVWNSTFNLNWTGGGRLSWDWYAGTLNFGPGEVVSGPAPQPAWANGASDTPPAGAFSVTTGNPVPTDPNIALIH